MSQAFDPKAFLAVAQYGAPPLDNSKSAGNALHVHSSLLNIVLHE
jgi:hypothetical protein